MIPSNRSKKVSECDVLIAVTGSNWLASQDVQGVRQNDFVRLEIATAHFSAGIKNGVLHGERGTRGKPGWLELSGNIGSDGTAILHANGTRPEKYNFQYQGAGPAHAQSGKPYAYDVAAQFKGQHGTGKRIGGRVGIFDIAKD